MVFFIKIIFKKINNRVLMNYEAIKMSYISVMWSYVPFIVVWRS